MHPYIGGEKYPVVTLSIEGEQKKFYLHRLYAEAYIPNPENKPHINHKDKNRQNISKENLEWVTQFGYMASVVTIMIIPITGYILIAIAQIMYITL